MKPAPLYKIGDFVKVKDLATLKAELGDPIKAQCGWVPGMEKCAGGVFEIENVGSFMGNGFHYSYKLKGAKYLFSEDTLEPEDEPALAEILISYENIMNM